MPKPVSAHQPFTLCVEDNPSAPTVFISDGSVSHALYFSFTNPDQMFEIDMRLPAKERLNIGMLIFNQAPENTMSQEQLPYIKIPSLGEMLEPTIRASFYEPYSQTDYIRLLRYNSSQLQDTQTISIQVRARAPGYFVLSLGYKEENRNIVIGGDIQQKNGENCLIAPNINNIIPEDKQTINNLQPAKEKEANHSTEILEYHNQSNKIVEINNNTNNVIFLIPLLITLLIGISVFIYYTINRKV